MLACLSHVSPKPSGLHPHICLFVCYVFFFFFFFLFPSFAPAPRAHSSSSLAATGRLINQIFKQCFSAQWVVLDYLRLLAAHGAATVETATVAGFSLCLSLSPLPLASARSYTPPSPPLIPSHFLSFPLHALFPSLLFAPSLYNCSFSHRLSDSERGPSKSSHLSVFTGFPSFLSLVFFRGISLPISPWGSPLWITIQCFFWFFPNYLVTFAAFDT